MTSGVKSKAVMATRPTMDHARDARPAGDEEVTVERVVIAKNAQGFEAWISSPAPRPSAPRRERSNYEIERAKAI